MEVKKMVPTDDSYDEENRVELVEGGEISAEEEGFMAGYESDENEDKKEEDDEEERLEE